MTTAEELDARYGRTGRRRWPLVAVGAIAAVLVALLGWSVVSAQMNAVDSDDLGFDLVDDHSVTVRFQITGAQGKDVSCIVEALDEEFGVVGWKVVAVPASDDHSQAVSATVPTVAEATTGLVKECRVA